MKSIVKQGSIAVGVVSMVFAATTAHAGGLPLVSTPAPVPTTPSAPPVSPPSAPVGAPDWTAPFSCGSGSAGGLLGSITNIVANTLQIQALNQVNVENICVVDVDDVLNGNILNLLTYSTLIVQNLLNVSLLQVVLNDVDVIDNDGAMLNFQDFISIGDINIGDVVGSELRKDGTLFIFHE
ncbi:hypothetical protein [Chondromyces crocatus]|uniref:Secreted protein n=1 Tax=Chondromyces crocatus TaxID=52 RepID=A0A0K1EET2_CHOCO|nr:hypothetical protein [Chondromyces crocatus]AKT39197.1 uncharacterized protein CMC5_033460 [Chondromyces crocatus]